MSRALASPLVQRSPILGQQLSEFLEQIIDPDPDKAVELGLDVEITAVKNIKTPQLRKTPQLQSPSCDRDNIIDFTDIDTLPRSPTLALKQMSSTDDELAMAAVDFDQEIAV